LVPEFAGKGRFSAGAKDEEAHGGWVGTESFDGRAGSGAGRVESVSKGCQELSDTVAINDI